MMQCEIMKQKKTKLVMFDYDGVLIDSNHLPKLYYDDLAAVLGTKRFASVEETREYLEVSVHDTLKKLGVNTPEKKEIAMKLFRSYDDKWKNLALFPAVREMLKTLKEQGYILAIVSNNYTEVIEHDLKKNNVHQYFEHIIDIKFGRKPETDQIMHCLKITGTHPEEAVMVDDMDGGIIAAKNAKLKKAIGVSYGYQLPERLRMADIIVHNPIDIIEAVK